MLLVELANEYDEAVRLLRQRIRELEDRRRNTQDTLEQSILARRTADLRTILRDTRTLAEICRRYYERSFWRDEHFCLQHPGQRAPGRHGGVAAGARRNQRLSTAPGTPEPETSDPGGPDRTAGDHAADAILAGLLHGTNRQRARRKPVHGITNTGPGQ